MSTTTALWMPLLVSVALRTVVTAGHLQEAGLLFCMFVMFLKSLRALGGEHPAILLLPSCYSTVPLQ